MKLKYTYFFFLAIIVWVANVSNSSGYGGSFTNCANCHTGGAGTTIIDSISFYDNVTSTFTNTYVPGRTYTVGLIGHHTGTLTSFGFQVTNNSKGSFSAPATSSKITSGIWEHSATNAATAGFFVSSSTWTAPVAGSGTVTINSYLNAVNNNNSDVGDKVSTLYTKTLTEFVPTASVTIAQTAGNNPICLYSGNVTFTATPVNGGTNPVFSWYINNIYNVASSGSGMGHSTMTVGGLQNNDQIKCIMTSVLSPVLGNPDTSNIIIANVIPVYDNTATLTGLDTTCAGDSILFTATPTTGATSPKYFWYKNNVKITGATNSTLKINGFNMNDSIYCRITTSNPCKTVDTAKSNVIKIYVKTSPVISNVINQTVCNGDSTVMTSWNSSVTGTTYTWTNNKTSIGLPASGSGDIPKFKAINTGNRKDSATITITPFANGCNGIPVKMKYYINPSPNAFFQSDISKCELSPQSTISFSSNVFGAVMTWNNDNTATGIATNGTSTIPSFTTSNITTDSVISIITYRGTSAGCVGPDRSFKYIVYDKPTTNTISNIVVCDGASTNIIVPSSNNSNSTFSWTNSKPSIGLAANGTGNIPSFTATNIGSVPDIALINVYSIYRSCTSLPSSFSITVNPKAPATLGITAASNTICIGNTASFTAIPVLGGSSPTFQWKINGVAVSGATSATFNSSHINNNDTVSCDMFSNDACANPLNATSNNVIMTVTGAITPAITIASNKDTFCTGDTVKYTSIHSGGGNTPTFQWYINGLPISGATSDSYSGVNILSTDSISCKLFSSLSCATVPSVLSNKKQVTVYPSSNLTATVIADKSVICQGDTVLFSSNVSGYTPNTTFEWKLNGSLLSNNSKQVLTTINSITDSVEFIITSNERCVLPNVLKIKTGLTSVLPSPKLTLIPAQYGDFCDGDSFLVKATGGLPGYIYNWSHGYTDTMFVARNSQTYYLTVSNTSVGCPRTYGPITIRKQPKPAVPTVVKYNTTSLLSSQSINYQWQLNKVDIVGEVSQSLVFSNTGLYRVKVSNTGGCSSYSKEIDPYLNTGATSSLNHSVVSIFPVPNQGVFTLDLSNIIGEKNIEIYDLKGTAIYRSTTSKLKETIDISHQGKGIYLIKVSNKNFSETLKINISQ